MYWKYACDYVIETKKFLKVQVFKKHLSIPFY
jgi:hypothetical protein